MSRKTFLFILFTLFIFKLFGDISGSIIKVGIETEGDWPPYEYFIRNSRGEATKNITGYSVDILNEAFAPYNISFEVVILPWTRLLKALEEGDRVHMILPTALNDDRWEKYLFTNPVYSITPSFFYLKEVYPNGIEISKPSDLLAYKKIGGKIGYMYEHFGLRNDDIDRGAKDVSSLVKILEAKRVNVILDRYEIFVGHSLIGEPYFTDKMGHSPMPGVDKEIFQFLISKNYEDAEELINILNEALDRLEKEGTLEEILKKYIQ